MSSTRQPSEDGVPGARMETLRGAGHIVNMEKPEEFDRIVLDFLAETEAGKTVSAMAPAGGGS